MLDLGELNGDTKEKFEFVKEMRALGFTDEQINEILRASEKRETNG